MTEITETEKKTAYEQAEDYLNRIPLFAKKNSPEKTAAFYRYVTERLPLPERTKIIHVAGTNGKGSVCAYLHSILTEAGFKAGMFTSPHLVTTRERFRVCAECAGNGESRRDNIITKSEFVDSFGRIRQLVDVYRTEHDPDYYPAYFEYLFFMIFPIYRMHPVDYLILETGLGGRLDATNVIPNPQLCIITEIGFDHTRQLGDTIAQIAGEKAGIIKPGVPVVYLDGRPEAGTVIRRKAEECGAKAYSVSKRDYTILSFGEKTIDFSYSSRYYGLIEIVLSTVARYQAENASLAIRAVEVLGAEPRISAEQIRAGLRKAFWAGRMEELAPEMYVDGAHNEDGIEAFVECVRNDGCKGRRMLLFSAVADKRVDAMIRILQREPLFERIEVVRLRSERGALPEQLIGLFTETKRAGQQLLAAEDMGAAFRDAAAWSREGGRVYIVGSLYLVGQIKELSKDVVF